MRTRAWPFSISRISKHAEVKNVSKKGSDRQGDSSLLFFFFGARFGGDEIEGTRDVIWHVFQNSFHFDLGGSLDYLFVFNKGNISQQETCDLDLEETLLTAR